MSMAIQVCYLRLQNGVYYQNKTEQKRKSQQMEYNPKYILEVEKEFVPHRKIAVCASVVKYDRVYRKKDGKVF